MRISLLRISLLRISLLHFFKTETKICLMRFYGLFILLLGTPGPRIVQFLGLSEYSRIFALSKYYALFE